MEKKINNTSAPLRTEDIAFEDAVLLFPELMEKKINKKFQNNASYTCTLLVRIGSASFLKIENEFKALMERCKSPCYDDCKKYLVDGELFETKPAPLSLKKLLPYFKRSPKSESHLDHVEIKVKNEGQIYYFVNKIEVPTAEDFLQFSKVRGLMHYYYSSKYDTLSRKLLSLGLIEQGFSKSIQPLTDAQRSFFQNENDEGINSVTVTKDDVSYFTDENVENVFTDEG